MVVSEILHTFAPTNIQTNKHINQRKMKKKRRNIAPVLRQMNIGDVEVFDVEQATSVRVTISRLQIEKRREKVMFATKVVGNTIQVTRK